MNITKPADADRFRHLDSTKTGVDQVRRCSHFRRSHSRTADELAIVLVLRSLARRIATATAEAAELEREILGQVRALVPELLNESGIGPIVARADRHMVTPRPRPLRGGLRTPCRRRAAACLERPNDSSPPQPRRGSSTQPRAPHRDPPPPTTRPRNQGLHRPPDRRGQERPRRHPHPQALPRPPPLPRDAKRGSTDDLTVIGDSLPHNGPGECHAPRGGRLMTICSAGWPPSAGTGAMSHSTWMPSRSPRMKAAKPASGA